MSVQEVLGEKASLFKTGEPPKPKQYTHVQVERSERGVITLPVGMPFDAAITWLKKMKEDEETVIRFKREYNAHPHDGAVALHEVLKMLFGWTEMHWPTFMTVKTGVNEQLSIPWGQFSLPGIGGVVATSQIGGKEDAETHKWIPLQFQLTAEIRKGDKEKVELIGQLVQDWLNEKSIYRGKAITVNRDFIDLSKTDPNDLIFGPEVAAQLEMSIFTPLEQTELCVQAGIPLKRGVLLYGPYGCGKSLCCTVTAIKAVRNGWTFLVGRPEDSLPQLLAFAQQYEPCCIFMEDLDAAISGEERTSKVNEILNTVDSVVSKGRRLMMVLTTNHLEKISSAMLRPGRLDAIIEISFPDRVATERLMRRYGRDLIPVAEDLGEAIELCVEHRFIPATIRELVERSKLMAISRERRADVLITGKDVLYAAGMLVTQQKLINRKQGKAAPVPLRDLMVVGSRMGKNGQGPDVVVETPDEETDEETTEESENEDE